jgi:hypothetical protein
LCWEFWSSWQASLVVRFWVFANLIVFRIRLGFAFLIFAMDYRQVGNTYPNLIPFLICSSRKGIRDDASHWQT